MVRRWITATVALLLFASSLTSVAGANGGSQQPAAAQAEAKKPAGTPTFFADLSPQHWAYNAVSKLTQSGVVAFAPGASFRPDDPISRAELLKMVLAARKIDPAGKCAAMFHDVPCTAWYAPYVETAYRMAIAEEIGDRHFNPNRQVTREQLVAIVVRSLGKRWTATRQSYSEISSALSPFTDRSSIDWYARPAMALALKEQLTSGYPEGVLRPKKVATRAEAASLIARVVLDSQGLQSAALDGHQVLYTQSMEMVASKYTVGEPGVGNITYTGVTVRTGAVAVDPNVIPLGTLLYVEDYGYAVAVDIGGAIKGNRIDLFSWEDHDALWRFGLQPRKVWILP